MKAFTERDGLGAKWKKPAIGLILLIALIAAGLSVAGLAPPATYEEDLEKAFEAAVREVAQSPDEAAMMKTYDKYFTIDATRDTLGLDDLHSIDSTSALNRIDRYLSEQQTLAQENLFNLANPEAIVDPFTGKKPEPVDEDSKMDPVNFGVCIYGRVLLVSCTMIHFYESRFHQNPRELLGYKMEIRKFEFRANSSSEELYHFQTVVFVKTGK